MFGISLQEFEALCHNRQRYTGYVEGLGYVFWKERLAIYKGRDTICYNRNSSNMQIPFYELVIIKDENNSQDAFSKLRGIKDVAINALSIYGAINSVEQFSTKPVTLGPDYIQINSHGTLIRNPNKNYTTKGKVAGKIGDKLTGIGIIVDLVLYVAGEQNINQTAINIGVPTGLFLIGKISVPVSVFGGILWFILNTLHTNARTSVGTYEQIHGSITPSDATKVHFPHCEKKLIPRIYERPQYYIKEK